MYNILAFLFRHTLDSRCPHIEAIPNGKVTGTREYGWNDEVGFECNPGYKLDGTKGLQCTQSGQWDGSIPKCVCKQIMIVHLVVECKNVTVNNLTITCTFIIDA